MILEDPLEIIGLLAGLLIAIASAPQLVKSFRTRSTKDLSLQWLLVLSLGLLLYVVYGFGKDVLPLQIFASVELAMMLTLIALKLKYK